MAIKVILHLDVTAEGPSWWADSPDVPGFTAASSTMNETMARASFAIADLIEEGDVEDQPVEFELDENVVSSDNPMVVERDNHSEAPSLGTRAHVLVA